MMRTSTLITSTEPRRMNSFSWITRRSLACVSRLMLPISSRKIEPPSATSKRPRFVAIAPVKAPFMWPKSDDSRSSGGSDPEFTVTKAFRARGEA